MKKLNNYQKIHFYLHKKIKSIKGMPLELYRIYDESKRVISDLAYRPFLTELESYQFDKAINNLDFIFTYYGNCFK